MLDLLYMHGSLFPEAIVYSSGTKLENVGKCVHTYVVYVKTCSEKLTKYYTLEN